MLIPVALGGLALACAGAAWLLGDGDAVLLRVLVAAAAVCTVVCAVLLRRWDVEASRQVAKERAAKAGMSWRIEERQAELEEAQELIATLEEKVRDKRSDLGRLRSEHADLLRRYATAETERAKALEGRRQLALEAAAPAKELPAQAADHRTAGGAPTPLTYRRAYEALSGLTRSAARQREARQEQSAEAPAPRPAPPAVAPPAQRTGGFDFFGARAPRKSGQETRETSGRG
ncbi:hypothetical protein [Streptomyces litchfieldiae]|uniref:Secreted protein n=1 Tax=Streptomyces litchfieldiae TaxID=3075543 RepID=A0ABU2MKX5_9ACTN|nr:hypothetical protein [Streptomyces sp. DSM 44938]MDT0341774.1 hypothetical protein [Streptomyces sp. DSM 44938]